MRARLTRHLEDLERRLERQINLAYATAAVPASVRAAPEDTARLKSSIRVFPDPALTWAPPLGLGVYVPSDAETAASDVRDLEPGEDAHVTVGVPYGPEQDALHQFMRAGHAAGVAAVLAMPEPKGTA